MEPDPATQHGKERHMADGTPLKLNGTAIIHPALPAALRPATRDVEGKKANEFLPDGYLKIDAAFDLSARARATAEGAVEKTLQVNDDQVVVLEMADGVTVMTTATKLKQSLLQVAAGAVDAGGALKLNRLQERGEAVRGLVGDSIGDLVSRVFTLTVGDVADPIIEAAKRRAAEWLDTGVTMPTWNGLLFVCSPRGAPPGGRRNTTSAVPTWRRRSSKDG